MEKDIFAPYEIAQKLKELSFKSDCLGWYSNVDKKLIICFISVLDSKKITLAPTWEQVFKWFRDRGYLFVIGYDFSDKKYNYKIVIKKHNEISRITSENYPTYEQARENLALELIEIYKKQNNE